VIREIRTRDRRVIDCQENGVGDVVVACWILHSAKAAGFAVHLNPRQNRSVALLLGVDQSQLTDESGQNWTYTPGIGTQYEYEKAPLSSLSRFDLWCASLDLPRLPPVRPNYVESPVDASWAESEWQRISSGMSPRVVLFPLAAWPVRTWPRAYFLDLVSSLIASGASTVVLGRNKGEVQDFPGHWLWGYDLLKVSALVRRADLVVANDSGPAHLAGTIGVTTLAICGPTRGSLVFGHDSNVMTVSFDLRIMPCVGCHFSVNGGFRSACRLAGCQALMRLPPDDVGKVALERLRESAKGCTEMRSQWHRAPDGFE